MHGQDMHIAEFNIGTLRYDWDDPRVKDFADNLDRVYAIAQSCPGYIWHMPEEQMSAGQVDPDGILGGNPRIASTLSVWADAASLEHFTWKTLHKQFVDRRGEWYDPAEQSWGGHRLVMWYVPVGHRPDIAEAADRLKHLERKGETEHAFGWTRVGRAA